jgi:hypothetical protein
VGAVDDQQPVDAPCLLPCLVLCRPTRAPEQEPGDVVGQRRMKFRQRWAVDAALGEKPTPSIVWTEGPGLPCRRTMLTCCGSQFFDASGGARGRGPQSRGTGTVLVNMTDGYMQDRNETGRGTRKKSMKSSVRISDDGASHVAYITGVIINKPKLL